MQTPGDALDYSPDRPPLHQRRSVRRAVCIVIAAALLLSAVWWLPPIWGRVTYLRYQSMAASQAIQPNVLVIDSSQAADPALPVWHIRYWKAWRQTHRVYPLKVQGAPLLMRRMKTAGGDERLVAVYGWLERGAGGEPVALVIQSWAMVPYSLEWAASPWEYWRDVDQNSLLGGSQIRVQLKSNDQVTLFSAIPHPSDPSKAEVQYVIAGRQGLVELELIDLEAWGGPPRARVQHRPRSGPIFDDRPWSSGG